MPSRLTVGGVHPAESVRVALRLGQDHEVLVPPRSEGEVATLVPEVIHGLLEAFAGRSSQVDVLNGVRRRVAEK